MSWRGNEKGSLTTLVNEPYQVERKEIYLPLPGIDTKV